MTKPTRPLTPEDRAAVTLPCTTTVCRVGDHFQNCPAQYRRAMIEQLREAEQAAADREREELCSLLCAQCNFHRIPLGMRISHRRSHEEWFHVITDGKEIECGASRVREAIRARKEEGR